MDRISGKEKGLYQKYKVERTDGKPIEGGCIVLEVRDMNAWAAINQFSLSVRKDGYVKLSNDINCMLKGELDRLRAMPEEDLEAEFKAKGFEPEIAASRARYILDEINFRLKGEGMLCPLTRKPCLKGRCPKWKLPPMLPIPVRCGSKAVNQVLKWNAEREPVCTL